MINSDQTGFQKNRFIGENVTMLNNILSYTDMENIPGLLLFIDFEKAFDTLEWSFIEKTLKYYNLGDSLILWIKFFYTDISSSVQNNGWSSDFFNLSTGARQGCPLSPYLFILCAEILGAAVRRDKLIRCIQISDNECKINQYADDTTLILDGTKSSIERSFLLLHAFVKLSEKKSTIVIVIVIVIVMIIIIIIIIIITCKRLTIIFYSEHVKMKEISVKLPRRIKHSFRNTTDCKQ